MDSANGGLVAVLSAAGRELVGGERQHGVELRTLNCQSDGNRPREVQVTGTAKVCCPADRVSVRVSVRNSKESVNEVTNSVTRRLEYIMQTLRHQGISDEDTTVRRFLQRDANMYHMDAEVLVTSMEFEKMEHVCSVLVEKLDKSVCVGTPLFYHSEGCLSQLRSQAFVSAVQNAQQKASKVSQLLDQSLGHPLLVREDETREWKNEEELDGGNGQAAAPVCQLPSIPTISAFSRVSVSFSLRDKSRKKL
ncbi:interleukin-1 receptor-associated kinase 1-binding protein 1 homolog [Betta splendens]|uniref:Interleukin-1 receptor-associated kinase 1-binding protein 1 homolog n=1 Tax=Betta splendens TaxID=158456 RepID=A0A6P7LQV5_BETSP|nr:interleukin-1 receptor-associated kinase 1-binding protein 1 homolog [Betta splendens]